MTYQLICDSCTDLPANMLRDPHVTKVALTIQVGPDTIIDDESFDQLDLLKKMRAWPDAPKTACPSPRAYMERFREDGDNYIVTLSSRLSGSYNAAAKAVDLYREEGGKANVHVFDSKSATAGQVQAACEEKGIPYILEGCSDKQQAFDNWMKRDILFAGQVQAAILIQELAEAGTPFEKVVEVVEERISRMRTMFVLETLDNLRKNGRLTRVQSLVTGALRVKLLMGGTREGEIEKLGQGLSIRQTLGRMVAYMGKNAGSMGRRLVITHCNCLERAEYVRDQVKQKGLFDEIIIAATGGIATVYANDGGVVVAY